MVPLVVMLVSSGAGSSCAGNGKVVTYDGDARGSGGSPRGLTFTWWGRYGLCL